MGFEARWYLPGRVMYAKFEGDVTSVDLRQAIALLVRELQYDPHKHLIIDATDALTYPSLSEIRNVLFSSDLSFRKSNNWVITYGIMTGVGQFIIAIALQLVGARFRTVGTLEQSLVFLQTLDTTLPRLLPYPSGFIDKTGSHTPLTLADEEITRLQEVAH